MSVSSEITRAETLVDAPEAPTPRGAPDAARSPWPVTPAPLLTSDDAVAWVRRTVAGMRRAIADGSLHHHRPEEVGDGRRWREAEVVRAWAGGRGPEAQRRLCGVCSDDPHA